MALWTPLAPHYDRLFPARPGVVGFLAGLCERRPARALDLGCGTATDAAGLAAVGLEVLALDPDPGMVAEAQRRHADVAGLQVAQGGTGDFGHPLAAWAGSAPAVGCLDLVVCIGNVAAHLAPAELADLLAGLRSLVRPGGVAVLQTVHFDRILAEAGAAGRYDFPALEDPAGEGRPALRFERSYEGLSEAGCSFHTRLFVDGALALEDEVPMFPHRAADVAAVARAVGFTACEHRGGFGDQPFGPRSPGPAVALLRP